MSYTPKQPTLEYFINQKACWRVSELAELFGVSSRSIRNWIQSGLVPAGSVRRPNSRLILIESWGALRMVRRWRRSATFQN